MTTTWTKTCSQVTKSHCAGRKIKWTRILKNRETHRENSFKRIQNTFDPQSHLKSPKYEERTDSEDSWELDDENEEGTNEKREAKEILTKKLARMMKKYVDCTWPKRVMLNVDDDWEKVKRRGKKQTEASIKAKQNKTNGHRSCWKKAHRRYVWKS